METQDTATILDSRRRIIKVASRADSERSVSTLRICIYMYKYICVSMISPS